MNEIDRAFLRSHLASLTDNERRKLYKRAALLRKTGPKPTTKPKPVSGFDEDDDSPIIIKTRPHSAPLDDIVVRILREEAAVVHALTGNDPVATVLTIHKSRCEIFIGGESRECRLSPALERTQQTDIAVGDLVTVTTIEGEEFIERVLPRRTKLSRPDPDLPSRERVIVANVDAVVIVVSLGSPPLHPRIIDRYLVAIQRGGAIPFVVLNKIDLLQEPAELDCLKPYADMGIPIVYCSTEQSIGVPDLLALVQGKTVAFVGHSGVGKSSLVHAIQPNLDVEIGSVSAGNRRGAHTTRRSTLYDLGNETRVIDTPGIRAFGLWQLDAEDLAFGFPEFQGLECRFRDCRHGPEPGCGIRRAVEEGRITPDRFETFLRMRESLDNREHLSASLPISKLYGNI